MDLNSLIRTLSSDGTLRRVALNVRTQFGTPTRRYIGAELMPERLVPENMFKESGIKYRSVIANSGTRYSPVQLKGGALVGEMEVSLAEADIGSQLTARDYDALLAALGRNASMDAVAQIVRFVETTVNRPLVELLEKQRWQAIVGAQVELRGDNGYSEDVVYSNPTGHRANAGGVWGNDSYDPFDDIFAMHQKLADKGYSVSRIITSRNVVSIMGGNDKVKTRAGHLKVAVGGSITVMGGRATLAAINGSLAEDGLPPIEVYDLQYQHRTGSSRFMPNNVMVLVAQTGRDEEMFVGPDTIELVPDTLGYVGIGRAAGQSAPGRVIRLESFDNKPPRVESEGWMTALPVIAEPEAIAVIQAISAT